MPAREITVTLDDVPCPLGIPICGRFIEDDELSHEQGIELLHDEPCFIEEDVME